MKKNHFIRIFIVYISIILIGSILIGIFSVQLFKYYFVKEAQVRMNSNINLIQSNIVDQNSKNSIDFDYLAKKYSKYTGATVTFLNSEGDVIGEKIGGINKNVKFLKKSEIVEAKRNKTGDNYFYNDKINIHILNIAKKVDSDNFKGFIHLSAPLNEVNEVDKGILSYSLIGVIFVLISSFILKIFFEKDIIAPISEITDNSRKVDINNLDSKLNIKSEDVLGIAAQEYNNMLDKLHSQVNKIEHRNNELESAFKNINVGIIIIDTESRIVLANNFAIDLFDSTYNSYTIREKKLIELVQNPEIINLVRESMNNSSSQEIETEIQANQQKSLHVLVTPVKSNAEQHIGSLIMLYDVTKEKRLEKMSSDFVSNVTHELKTPLTSIKGFIETLKEGAIEDKQVSYKFLEIIDLECDRLYCLINDILQLSEIQDLEQDVNLSFYYVQDIVLEVIAFLDGQIKKKDISISTDIQDDIPLMLINKDRLKQMFINIIDNAIKYTFEGGKVEVRVSQEDDYVVTSVKDNGIGIPQESKSRLFERFYRVDKGRSRRQGGTGLGLSIVKQIVDLYDGEIDIKSEVNEGTEFIVKLPVKSNRHV